MYQKYCVGWVKFDPLYVFLGQWYTHGKENPHPYDQATWKTNWFWSETSFLKN